MAQVEMRLEGEGVSLRLLPLTNWLQVLALWDQALRAQAAHLATGKLPPEALPRLTRLEEGSLRAVLLLPAPVTAQAWLQIVDAVQRHQRGVLVRRTLEALYQLRAWMARHNWRLHCREARTQRNLVLEATTTLPETQTFVQHTTLYGQLLRIGGDDPPTAMLRLADGQRVTARLSRARQKGTTLAKRLAAYLYEWVGVRGRIEISLPERQIERLLIEDILDYRPAHHAEQVRQALREVSPGLQQYASVEEWLQAASWLPHPSQQEGNLGG